MAPSNVTKVRNTKKRTDAVESGQMQPRIQSSLEKEADSESQISHHSYISKGGVSGVIEQQTKKINMQNKRHSAGNLHLVNNKLSDNKFTKK